MKQFPNILNVDNKDMFSDILYRRYICYLRREIYEHMLRNNENDYFAIDSFATKYNIDIDMAKQMTHELIEEIQNIGWKCRLGFNDTGLFIYSTENPPPNWWG